MRSIGLAVLLLAWLAPRVRTDEGAFFAQCAQDAVNLQRYAFPDCRRGRWPVRSESRTSHSRTVKQHILAVPPAAQELQQPRPSGRYPGSLRCILCCVPGRPKPGAAAACAETFCTELVCL
jgi:hypothetical protein